MKSCNRLRRYCAACCYKTGAGIIMYWNGEGVDIFSIHRIPNCLHLHVFGWDCQPLVSSFISFVRTFSGIGKKLNLNPSQDLMSEVLSAEAMLLKARKVLFESPNIYSWSSCRDFWANFSQRFPNNHHNFKAVEEHFVTR